MNDPEPHQGRILLVDDEALIALSEKKILETYGYEVITAHSGDKAVETAIRDTAVSLVLMDIDLGGGIDGTEAAEQILEQRSLPIVFLTSHAEKEYVDRVKSITNYGYVLKGSGEFVLNESITMALQLFEAHQETAHKEERLSFIVNEAPVGIFQSSSNGTLRRLNSEMARILGFDAPEEALHYYTDIGQQLYVFQQRRNELLKRIEEHGVVRDFRFEIVRVTGEKAYLKVNAHRVPNSGENEMLINAFVIDETERQEAERRLDESQKQYQSVVDLAHEIIVRHDIEGKWTFVNEAACEFFGQSREDLIGQHYMDYVHPDDREEARAAHRTMTDNEEGVQGLVNRSWTPAGYRTVEWNSSPFTDEHGRFSGHQAIGRPLTEETQLRKQAEQEVHEKAEFLQRVTDNVSDTIGVTDLNGNFTYHSKLPPVTGYQEGALVGKNVLDLVHPEDLEESRAAFEEFVAYEQDGRRVEYRFRCADGHYIWFETDGAIIRDEAGTAKEFLFIARDISERKEFEEKLRESEEHYRLLAENIIDIVYKQDLENESPTYVSPSVEKVLGYTPEEALFMRLGDVLTEDSYTRHSKALENAIETREPSPGVTELEVVHKDGHIVPIETHPSLIRDETGAPKAVVSVVRDISQRKKKAKRVEEMYSRLQTVIDNIPFLINEIDVDGRYVLVNEATCKVVGLSKEQVMGKHFKEVLPHETATTFQHRIEQVYTTGKQLTVDDRLNLGGEQQVFRTVLTPILQGRNTIQSVVGIAYDVSHQIEALQRKDLLMRELNHRVKNNLHLVSSLVDLKDSSLGSEVDLSDIRNQINAIAKVHEALQYSDDITHINLKSHVANVLSSVFKSSTGHDITVVNTIPDIAMRTKTALPLGLIINETAANAFKHGFKGQEEPRFTLAMEKDATGENYVLTISNTGRPFPEDVDIENPQGLGLQLVSALVAQLQGTLELHRTPHPVFTIRFPLSER